MLTDFVLAHARTPDEFEAAFRKFADAVTAAVAALEAEADQ